MFKRNQPNQKKKDVEGKKKANSSFQKLTPTKSVDLDGYKEALDFIFENPDIRNIAISGIYGSGKTSVIETFEKENPKKKFIHISLAHFTGDSYSYHKENPNLLSVGQKTLSFESVIEGKILNQLIQQIPQRRIPQTNFNTKSKMIWYKVIPAIILFILLFSSIFFCLKFPAWQKYITDPQISFFSFLSFTAIPDFRLVFYLIGMLILGIIGFFLIKAQHNKRFLRKLSVKGTDIEIFAESNDSFFDKYLNEVIYLFRKANAEGFIFEDIDRFDNLGIFSRLREINALVNAQSIYRQKKGKKVIRFFYMVRDDLFTNKDRTKFFDFIIPIIPVVDGSNSYEKIKEFIHENELSLKDGSQNPTINDQFIRNISLYIDDMRIAKNIINEYFLFSKRLHGKTIGLNPDKLFAMITYKNLFPSDYARLQVRDGFVYNLFWEKEQIREKVTEKLHKSLEEKKAQVARCQKETLKSIEEFNIVNNYSYSLSTENRKKWAEEYEQRKENVRIIESNTVNAISEEISQISNHLEAINGYSFSELISNADTTLISKYLPESKENKENNITSSPYYGLLKSLVMDGYIDESYSDYMTYFYEGSLSVEDKNFLRGNIERIAHPYEYKLKNPATVVSWLNDAAFSKLYSLNYDLTEEIIDEKNDKLIAAHISLLKKTKCFDYIQGYMQAKPDAAQFVCAINQYWPDMFHEAYTSNLSKSFLTEFSYQSLLNESEETIKRIDDNSTLHSFISDTPNYLDKSIPDIEKVGNGFQAIGVLFSSLQIGPETNLGLFDYVYNNNLYRINADNIRIMLVNKCDVNDPEKILPKLFTYIYDNQKIPLCNYLLNNIVEAFNVYLLMYRKKVTDINSTIIKIINNQDIKSESKADYLARLRDPIADINVIEKVEDRDQIVKCKAMNYTVNNIMDYYQTRGSSLTPELVDFINSQWTPLQYEKYPDKAVLEKFRQDCLDSSIELSQYQNIFTHLKDPIAEFTTKNLSTEKIEILIDARVIVMNEKNLRFIRANYPNEVIEFIHTDAIEYTNIVSTSPVLVNQEETIALLGWEDVPDIEKINFLDITKQNVSIQGQNYSDQLMSSILTEHFMTEDIPWILFNYCTYSAKIQSTIVDVAMKNIDSVIPHAKETGNELLDVLINSVSFDNQIRFLENVSGHVSIGRLCEILSIMHCDKIADHLNGKYRVIPVKEDQETVLNVLYKTGVIEKPEVAADGKSYKMLRKV